jgi:hypothetical protein
MPTYLEYFNSLLRLQAKLLIEATLSGTSWVAEVVPWPPFFPTFFSDNLPHHAKGFSKIGNTAFYFSVSAWALLRPGYANCANG